jgi:hypothetical protein
MVPPIDPNLELMKAMGAKRYDPIPPDQYLFFLTSDDDEQRYLAYIRQHTIGYPNRSAFAVNPDGSPVSQGQIARACFYGHKRNAAAVGERVAAKGLISFDERGRIYLCGEVKAPARARRTKGEGGCVHSPLPAYLIESINSLKGENKAKALSTFDSITACESKAIADAVTTVRIKFAQVKDNACLKFGLPIKRLDKKHRPDLHERGSQCVQLQLVLPDDLQQFVGNVQTQERTQPENGFVHSSNGSRIISVFKNREETPTSSSSSVASAHTLEGQTTTNSGPPAADFHNQHVAVWQAAGKNGVPTWKQSETALRTLGRRAEEFLRWITPQKLERVKHCGALPKLVEEFLQTKPAEPTVAGPVCWKCGGSLERGSVDGACFQCAEVVQGVAR